MLHRDLSYTYSVTTRVFAYTIPVLTLSFIINIPKFFETQLVVETQSVLNADRNRYVNITTYTIDVTDLRNDPIYIKYYMNIARTVLLGLVPFAALIFFNVKIYLRFLITRKRYNNRNNNCYHDCNHNRHYNSNHNCNYNGYYNCHNNGYYNSCILSKWLG